MEETFTNLRRFNIKLNPEKCVFGVPKGKLLGFIVSAITNTGPIHDVKGIQ